MELLGQFVILPGFFPHLMIDDLTRSCSLSVCLISAERNNEVLLLAGLIFDLSTMHFFPNKRRGIFPSLDKGVCVCVCVWCVCVWCVVCVCEVGILFISSC